MAEAGKELAVERLLSGSCMQLVAVETLLSSSSGNLAVARQLWSSSGKLAVGEMELSSGSGKPSGLATVHEEVADSMLPAAEMALSKATQTSFSTQVSKRPGLSAREPAILLLVRSFPASMVARPFCCTP